LTGTVPRDALVKAFLERIVERIGSWIRGPLRTWMRGDETGLAGC
jgi:hypothetical protein